MGFLSIFKPKQTIVEQPESQVPIVMKRKKQPQNVYNIKVEPGAKITINNYNGGKK